MDASPFSFPVFLDRQILNTVTPFLLSVPQKGRSLLVVTAGELRVLPGKAVSVSFFVSAGNGIFLENGISYQLQNMTPEEESAFFCLTYPEAPCASGSSLSFSSPAVSDTISLSDHARINSAMDFIASHYADPLTLDDIASHIYVGREECCRCFKRALTLSPFEYLTRFRLEKTLEWLGQKETASQTISELAALAGFNNASYFAKIFREYFHCTPSQYRQRMLSSYSS